MAKYPCKKCKLNLCENCDKLESDSKKLIELFLKSKRCPDCGSKDFYIDDSGVSGVSIDIKCNICEHWFRKFYAIERINK